MARIGKMENGRGSRGHEVDGEERKEGRTRSSSLKRVLGGEGFEGRSGLIWAFVDKRGAVLRGRCSVSMSPRWHDLEFGLLLARYGRAFDCTFQVADRA